MSLVKSISYENSILEIYSELPNLIELDDSTGDLIQPSFPNTIGVALPSGNVAIYRMYETTDGATGNIENYFWQKKE